MLSPKTSKPAIAFGAEEWAEYFGDVGIEPPLPSNIEEIPASSCPFHPEESIENTHLLTLIPATVGRKTFTLDLLGELVKHPKQGTKTGYRFNDQDVRRELGSKAPNESYWALMTKDIIPRSRNKEGRTQLELVESYKEKSRKPYEVPGALEATACILMEYVRTGKSLYTNSQLGKQWPHAQCKQWTYTRCKERVSENQRPVAIGGFGVGGLNISLYLDDRSYDYIGVASVWKL